MPYTVDAGGRVRSTGNNANRGKGADALWEAIQQGGGVVPPGIETQPTPFPGTQSPSEILAGYETSPSVQPGIEDVGVIGPSLPEVSTASYVPRPIANMASPSQTVSPSFVSSSSLLQGNSGVPNISGSSVLVQGDYSEPNQEVNLPDLNPMIEGVRDYLNRQMTNPSSGQQSATLSGGVTPIIPSSGYQEPSEFDTSELEDAVNALRDGMLGAMTEVDPEATSLATLSAGTQPSVNSSALRPTGEPAEFSMPKIDWNAIVDWSNDLRERTLPKMTKPVDAADALTMPSLGTGAVPTVSKDSMETETIFDSDAMLGYVGRNANNEAYIEDAIKNGMSKEEAEYLLGRLDDDAWKDGEGRRGVFSLPMALNSSEPISVMGPDGKRIEIAPSDSRDQGGLLTNLFTGNSVLDDGSVYDYDHMTADNMTGTQYLHYAEMGMGGRPIEEIDPTETYSKRREHINYGFVPFVPDTLAYANMVADNVMDFPARLGSLVGGAREEIANAINPYGINVNGKYVPGPEFDRKGGAYVHQMERNERYHPESFLMPNDRAIPTIVEYSIPDESGKTTYHYGHLTGAYTDIDENGNDVYGLEFSDGSDVHVSPDYFSSITTDDGMIQLSDYKVVTPDTASGSLPDLESMNDVDEIMATDNPLSNADVLWYPDLVLSDGTRLNYDEASSIYYDHGMENDLDQQQGNDITYDITKSIIPTLDNRPRRLNTEIFGEDGIDLSSLGNNVSDWTLGSLPISVTRLGPLNLSALPWLYSASNASSSLSGLDPGTYDLATDSYGLAFGNYDKDGNLRYGMTTADGDVDESLADEAKFWNFLGNAAVPLTEQIVGPVGEYGIPVRKLLNMELPDFPTIRQVLGDLAIGAVEEGVEEDLGNIFDELTGYGPKGAFANQVMNENGTPMYDLTGHEVRDYSTSGKQRLDNLMNFEDLANSFVGGALVDLAMQMGPGSEFRNNMGNAMYRNRIRQELGIDPYVEPTTLGHRQVSESYLDQFDDNPYDDENENELIDDEALESIRR